MTARVFDPARRAVLLEVLGSFRTEEIEAGRLDLAEELAKAKSTFSPGMYLSGMLGVPQKTTRSRRAIFDSAGHPTGEVEMTTLIVHDGKVDPFSAGTLDWLRQTSAEVKSSRR